MESMLRRMKRYKQSPAFLDSLKDHPDFSRAVSNQIELMIQELGRTVPKR